MVYSRKSAASSSCVCMRVITNRQTDGCTETAQPDRCMCLPQTGKSYLLARKHAALQYFCKIVPLSFLADQSKLLFWEKVYISINVISYSLSSYVLGRFIAVGLFFPLQTTGSLLFGCQLPSQLIVNDGFSFLHYCAVFALYRL